MEITKVACNRCVLLKKLNSIQSCTYIYANVVTEKIRRTIMNMKYKRKMDHANTFDNIYHHAHTVTQDSRHTTKLQDGGTGKNNIPY